LICLERPQQARQLQQQLQRRMRYPLETHKIYAHKQMTIMGSRALARS
jgi:hypothetical protein